MLDRPPLLMHHGAIRSSRTVYADAPSYFRRPRAHVLWEGSTGRLRCPHLQKLTGRDMAGLMDVDQDSRACDARIYKTDFDTELVCTGSSLRRWRK